MKYSLLVTAVPLPAVAGGCTHPSQRSRPRHATLAALIDIGARALQFMTLAMRNALR